MMETINAAGFETDGAFIAAEANGFFADQDLAVTFTQVGSSTDEICGLLEGRWDIAFDNGDNVVAWAEGDGADGKPHDLLIFPSPAQVLRRQFLQ
jgi:ABC-type nitrate/sulfonate/bicarbonate transport system substrate-binding protein